MISLIIPVYNAENTLSRCLDSVCCQTYKDLEIICVNDGSQDGSLKILQEYSQKDKRIKIIDKENVGVSSARNAGMKIAQGDWICFVDSDDYVDTNFCEELLKSVEENKADFAICSTIQLDKNGKTWILPPYGENILKTFSDKVQMFRGGACWDKIYSHDLLKKYNILFEEGHNWEGNLFLLKVAKYSNRFASTPKTFYHYIYNENSICFNKEDEQKRIQDRLFVLKSIFNWAKEEKLNHGEMRVVLALIERSVVDGGFYKTHFKEIVQQIGIKNYLKWIVIKSLNL